MIHALHASLLPLSMPMPVLISPACPPCLLLPRSISDADVSAEEARLAAAPQHVAAGYKEFMDNLK